ncbi:MAG: PIN domain-containing protein [Candidatus Nanopelagicales bacterium]
MTALDSLLAGIDYELASPSGPSVPISDPDDQPILDAAVAGAVDVIVTGDKAFLSAGLERPRILTARGFLDWYPSTGALPAPNFEELKP